jgi:hypothetical protein
MVNPVSDRVLFISPDAAATIAILLHGAPPGMPLDEGMVADGTRSYG